MPSYTFDTTPNSYFLGQDIQVTDHANGTTILVNMKEGRWAVNVKDDLIRSQYPADIQRALDTISERKAEDAYNAAVESFWDDAQKMAEERGFEEGVATAGRSSGWLALPDTLHWEAAWLLEPKGRQQLAKRDRFLSLGFEAVANIDTVRENIFYENVRAAMRELQAQLDQLGVWVGAEVRGLDGDIGKVAKVEAVQGRPALRWENGMFSFANESQLVRKADGQVPARITADPIMEQVFRIIEARGNLTKDQIDSWLDADDENDPVALYEEQVAPAVNAIEDAITAHYAAPSQTSTD